MVLSQTYIRSISLPSRLHSTGFEIEQEKLKSCIQISVNSEAIRSSLLLLAEMYNFVRELAQSSTTQNSVALHHHRQDEKSMEESLSASVELLDTCRAVRELFQMMEENVQDIHSALRRKGLDSSVQNDIAAYFCCRKKMNKSISKTLKNLKKSEQINGSYVSINAGRSFSSVFRELTGATIAIFKSVLVFLSSQVARHGGWSLVSKKLRMAKSRKDNDDVVNEVRNADLALSSLQGKFVSNGAAALDNVQKRLQSLGAIVEGLDGGLERLFRHLIQIRVTLLNIVTDH